VYEQDFQYSKGSPGVTPRDWFLLAWDHFRKEIAL
jgi:hypothetical protein